MEGPAQGRTSMKGQRPGWGPGGALPLPTCRLEAVTLRARRHTCAATARAPSLPPPIQAPRPPSPRGKGFHPAASAPPAWHGPRPAVMCQVEHLGRTASLVTHPSLVTRPLLAPCSSLTRRPSLAPRSSLIRQACCRLPEGTLNPWGTSPLVHSPRRVQTSPENQRSHQQLSRLTATDHMWPEAQPRRQP